MSRQEINEQFAEELKKGMAGSAFMEEIIGTTKVFGRDSEITISFEGDRAYVDGNRINYPAIDQSVILSDREVRIGRGFVDHESAHIRHTDIPFFQDRAKNAEKLGNQQLIDTFNCVEDVRIERLANQTYRGAMKNLSTTADASCEMYLEAYAEDPSIADNDERVTPVALTWIGREDMNYDAPNLQKCLSTLSPTLQAALGKWNKEMRGVSSTQEAYDLARRIVHDLNTEQYQQPEYQQQQTGEGMGEDQEAPPDEGEGEGEGNQQGESDGEGQGREQGDEKESVAAESKFDPYNFDHGNLLNHTFQNLEDPVWNNYKAFSTRFDKIHHVSDPDLSAAEEERHHMWQQGNAGAKIMKENSDIKKYFKRLEKSSGQINSMRRKLEKAIQAKQRTDWDYGKEYGRLDSRRLPAAYNWQPNVYKTREEAPALDTAVTILIDLSGSMSYRKADLACDVAISLYECLTKIGVPFEILGWNNTTGFVNQAEYDEWNKATNSKHWRYMDEEYDRVTPLHTYVFKAFKDKPKYARAVMPTIPDCVGGCNADGEALSIAYQRLKVRPEQRKIFMVLSDGQPACDGWCDGTQRTHLRNTVHRIEEAGVDLLGIGIMDESVKYYYPKWTVCHNLEDLPKAAFDMISKSLMGERFIVDNSELLALKGK
jgi:cobaltochelatase CobT